MKRCLNCNYDNDDLNAICEYCGVQFPDVLNEDSFTGNYDQSIYDNYGQDSYNNQRYYDMNNYHTARQEKSGKWAMVCGILSLFRYPLIFGILAIYLGTEAKTGVGKAGRALGIIGLCLMGLDFLLDLM